MKLEIDIKVGGEEKAYEADLKRLAEKTVAILEKSGSAGLSANFRILEQGIVEFGFLGDQEMKDLNREYRQKDEITDVLSFSFLEGEKFPGDNLIGQIFISLSVSEKQAKENNWSLREEVNFLFVHGLLHVLGFDHLNKIEFEEMFKWHGKIQPDAEGTINKIREGSFD